MTARAIERDERTTMVENAGYRLAYLVLSFGVLAAVAIRSFAQRQSSWDLLGLVIVSGGVHAGYQVMHKVVGRRWVLASVITLVVAVIVALIMVKATGWV